MNSVALSGYAAVNPATPRPALAADAEVSFIPMSDVDENGRWVHHQTRQLRDIGPGYTAFREWDVLVAKITPCLENGKGALATGLVNGVGFGSTEFHVLRARPNADPTFIYQVTQDRRFRLRAGAQMVGSAGQQRVPVRFFDEYLLPNLSDEEQRDIGRVLSQADEAIDRTRALIAKRRRLHAGLVQALLTRGLDSQGRLRDEATHAFKDSPLGRIPVEWSAEPLGRYTLSSAFGPRFPADRYAERGAVALLRTTDMDDDGNVTYEALPRADLRPEAFAPHLLVSGDLFISRSGTLGITGIFDGHSLPVLPGAFLIRFRLDDTRYSPHLLRRYFNAEVGRRRVLALAAGGVQQNLKGSALRSLVVPVPQPPEQIRLIRTLRRSEDSLAVLMRELDKLTRLKAGLMQALLTGVLPVAS
jgi:type I restriction enzyme, S subunit